MLGFLLSLRPNTLHVYMKTTKSWSCTPFTHTEMDSVSAE